MFYIFIVVHKGSTYAFMNFQPGLKFLVDYMGNFSPINRAENHISGSSNRAEVSSCNRKLRFTRILLRAESSSRAENPHVISPLGKLSSGRERTETFPLSCELSVGTNALTQRKLSCPLIPVLKKVFLSGNQP